MVKWYYQPDPIMRGAVGEAFSSPFHNNELPLGDRFARESLQNCRDANLEHCRDVKRELKLKVEYKFVKFTGSKKKSFVEALNLSSVADRKGLMGLQGDNCLDHLGNDDEPIRALYVSDYNTCGLHGHPLDDKGSHLGRFLLAFGDRSKSRGPEALGGSFGYGKGAYCLASKVKILVAYSRFDGHQDSDISARLMGAGYHPPYERDKKDYNGRSFFGVPWRRDDEVGYDAISNDQAHALAEQLGFKKRENGESGASVLILDPLVKAEDLIRGIETWWWPACVSNQMDVTVVDEDGASDCPKPGKRRDLCPFIETFRITRKVSEPKKHQALSRCLRSQDHEIGSAAVTFLDENAQNLMGERLNSIAMIRLPGMVVRYYPIGGAGASIAGTYLAPKGITVDKWLSLSEPYTHDVWDAASPALEDPVAGMVIKAIHAKLKFFCGQFRQTASPPPERSRKSLKIFEKALGHLFRNRSKGERGGAGGTGRDLHITFDKQPQPQVIKDKENVIKFVAEFSVSLDTEYAESKAQIKVDLNCSIVEDEGAQGDSLPVHARVKGGTLKEKNGSYVGQIQKGEPIRFQVESDPYNRMWSVQFVPEVVVLKGEE